MRKFDLPLGRTKGTVGVGKGCRLRNARFETEVVAEAGCQIIVMRFVFDWHRELFLGLEGSSCFGIDGRRSVYLFIDVQHPVKRQISYYQTSLHWSQ